MARLGGVALLIFVCIAIFFIIQSDNPKPIQEYSPEGDINIAAYNMQIFGISKLEKPELMRNYKELIEKYDLFFIQEIRDESGLAFKELCDSLNNYSCSISSRAGSTQTKEQYGVVWDSRINVTLITDYNLLNYSDTFERPPIRVDVSINNKTLDFYIIHTKPENAAAEITSLEQLVVQENLQNVVIMGDLNMDCDYYSGANFAGYDILINSDTTTGSTNCAYDRIIVSHPMNLLVLSSGVDTTTDNSMSDHYPIFLTISKDV